MKVSEQWEKQEFKKAGISSTEVKYMYLRDERRNKIGLVVKYKGKYGWSLYNYSKERKQPNLLFGLQIACHRAVQEGYDALEDIEKRINRAELYRIPWRLAKTRSAITLFMFKSRRAEK